MSFDYFVAHHLTTVSFRWAIHEFASRTMGYGFKTALEVVLVAAEAGAMPIDEEAKETV
jgi:hypothetical protein